MIKHSQTVNRQLRIDGDIDAVVVNVDTRVSTVTVYHGLGRVPVGCQIILSDQFCNVKTLSSDATKIIVAFSVNNANVNLRIW